MVRLLPVLCLAMAVYPAFAQQRPAAPLTPNGEQMRAFSLRNQSHQPITSAEAHMTDGKDRVLTYAPVQPNQARQIVVPRQECVDSVTVHLNIGKTLHADHLQDCRATQIMVGDAGIGVQSNVNPRSRLIARNRPGLPSRLRG